jgi:RNA polymerase sigma-70 factor (ECF subfamily)
VLQSRGNDQVAEEARFRALFDAHYRAISRYFRSRHLAAEVEDLTAATFEVAWRQLDAVPAGEEAVPWLLAAARNQSRNAWRKTQREAAFIAELIPTVSTSAEMAIQEREELAETMQALAQPKPQDRDLIMLVTWDELTPSDAGRVLGLRPNAARTRLHRARQRLAALLEAGTPPGPATGRAADHRDEGSHVA